MKRINKPEPSHILYDNAYSKQIIPIEIGTRFGNFTVIGEPKQYCTPKSKRAMFPCRCDCGREKGVLGTYLRQGKRIKCPTCSYRSRANSLNRSTNVERMYKLSIVDRCRQKNIQNNLLKEEYESLIAQNCYYCNEPPKLINHLNKNKLVIREDFYANGIDRIDSSKGYELSNCVPCCKHCNVMKLDYTTEEFLNRIKSVYEKWFPNKPSEN